MTLTLNTYFFLFRCLLEGKIKFSCPRSALVALTTGHKYICWDLISLASKYLITRLDDENVLLILQEILNNCPSSNLTVSVPLCTQPTLAFENSHDGTSFKCCEKLRNTVMLYIDTHAHSLLMTPSMMNTSLPVLKAVLCRSNLRIDGELQVWKCVLAWSRKECFRRGLDPTPTNMRAVLDGCQYLVRYFTMTSDELREGPLSCELLQDEEIEALIATMKSPSKPLPDHLEPMKRSLAEHRVGARERKTQVDETPNANQKVDHMVARLQEWKEKECAFKELGWFDQIIFCLRCVFD